MYIAFCRLLGFVISRRRADLDKELEIVVLRHQVRILERQLHVRVRFRPADRAVLAALSRWLPRARWRVFLVNRTPCSAGTGNWAAATGDAGAHNERPGDRRCPTSSLS